MQYFGVRLVILYHLILIESTLVLYLTDSEYIRSEYAFISIFTQNRKKIRNFASEMYPKSE